MNGPILLIKDHDLTRTGLRLALEQHPQLCFIAEASTGETGLVLARKHRPHLAVVDVGLPGIDGATVTRVLKEELPETKVLALTMYEDSQTVTSVLASGADSYCTKNIDAEELVEAVRRTHAGFHVVDPAVGNVVLEGIRSDALLQTLHHTKWVRSIDAWHEQIAWAPGKSPLTERELEVLGLIVCGCSNIEIAKRLYVTVGTVKTHVRNLLGKLGAMDRTQAAVTALRSGLVR